MGGGTNGTNYLGKITTEITMYIMFILVEHFDVSFLLFHDHQVWAATDPFCQQNRNDSRVPPFALIPVRR